MLHSLFAWLECCECSPPQRAAYAGEPSGSSAYGPGSARKENRRGTGGCGRDGRELRRRSTAVGSGCALLARRERSLGPIPAVPGQPIWILCVLHSPAPPKFSPALYSPSWPPRASAGSDVWENNDGVCTEEQGRRCRDTRRRRLPGKQACSTNRAFSLTSQFAAHRAFRAHRVPPSRSRDVERRRRAPCLGSAPAAAAVRASPGGVHVRTHGRPSTRPRAHPWAVARGPAPGVLSPDCTRALSGPTSCKPVRVRARPRPTAGSNIWSRGLGLCILSVRSAGEEGDLAGPRGARARDRLLRPRPRARRKVGADAVPPLAGDTGVHTPTRSRSRVRGAACARGPTSAPSSVAGPGSGQRAARMRGRSLEVGWESRTGGERARAMAARCVRL